MLEAQSLPHVRDLGTSSSLFVRLTLGQQVAVQWAERSVNWPERSVNWPVGREQ